MTVTLHKHNHDFLTKEQLLKMLDIFMRARKLDEKMWLLQRAGRIPFTVSGQGQEAAQIGLALALDDTRDYILPYYRDIALVLGCGLTVRDVLLQAFGKAQDPNSGGRQMTNHFGSKKHRIVTGSSPVGTQIPQAAGVALASKMRGEQAVTVVTIGDGSTNQGDFHEGLNFAAVHKLPLVVVIENNGYAISVPQEKQYACEKLSDRAIGYGIYGETIDGHCPMAVYETMVRAIEHARSGRGPVLIEVMVTRQLPHSSDDDHRPYRAKEELDALKMNDSYAQFKQYFIQQALLTATQMTALEQKVTTQIEEVVEEIELLAEASPEQALQHVYKEETP